MNPTTQTRSVPAREWSRHTDKDIEDAIMLATSPHIQGMTEEQKLEAVVQKSKGFNPFKKKSLTGRKSFKDVYEETKEAMGMSDYEATQSLHRDLYMPEDYEARERAIEDGYRASHARERMRYTVTPWANVVVNAPNSMLGLNVSAS